MLEALPGERFSSADRELASQLDDDSLEFYQDWSKFSQKYFRLMRIVGRLTKFALPIVGVIGGVDEGLSHQNPAGGLVIGGIMGLVALTGIGMEKWSDRLIINEHDVQALLGEEALERTIKVYEALINGGSQYEQLALEPLKEQ